MIQKVQKSQKRKNLPQPIRSPERRAKVCTEFGEKLGVSSTETHGLNEDLKANEALYKAIVEDQTEFITRILLDGTIIFVNEAYCRCFGKKQSELLGQTIWSLIPEEDHEELKKHFAELTPENPVGTHENRAIGANGMIQWQQWTNRAVLNDKAKVIGIQSVGRDVTERKAAYEELRKREEQLEIKTKNLEEVNTALKVLLRNRGEENVELENKVLANIKILVLPYLEKLKRSALNDQQESYLDILKSNLENIISPFSTKLSSKFLNLTPSEIQIADMIRRGKRTKDIANFLGLASSTIDSHRKNIRKKLGIGNKKANLRTYLSSIKGNG
jgi:PAS domain S-box-containing protein